MAQHNHLLESYSGRLRLVPPDPAFDETIVNHRTHPETLRHLRILPAKTTAEEQRVRREGRIADPRIMDFYAFRVNPDGSRSNDLMAITGLFNLDTIMNSCEIGILVAPGKHYDGYGTEVLHALLRFAFEERKIHRATFETAVDNIPMQKWLERAGIRLEAERKEAWRGGDGHYEDVKGYAVLEWEWRNHVKENLEARMRARQALSD